ncbi:hypothetical protein JF66_03875 [Cryobacterium sp. MLB-32]|uniref:ATP-grasp domain-containing protein n=1 Tax=Cryobacterium sp. MLB-32 TaxID=1529318 RepID=UPI0004E74C86|nr:ATP-grasp domain-containing protein [Cryobacterium sp. MLB-32]KFF60503.1 hypothetical protein JF66_03875 [Cryobacterium sp. MLB-32]
MARTGFQGGTRTASDTRHLGTLVGDGPLAGGAPGARIIALSTCAVFSDTSLLRTYWRTDPGGIDSGIQGHLYTSPDDTFIVRMPRDTRRAVDHLSRCLAANAEIWASLTGIRLATCDSRVVLAADHASVATTRLPPTMSWQVGTLAEAAAAEYRSGNGSLLAFVLDEQTADALGVRDARLLRQARLTSLLMDKNHAMTLLERSGVPAAHTYALTEAEWLAGRLRDVPEHNRYVFKPAGGAAGIGVFFDAQHGSSMSEIEDHLRVLANSGRLPHRFQVQEFLAGTPHGVSAYLPGDGTAHILEAHRQVMDAAGRCVGARWTPDIESDQVDAARAVYQRLAHGGQHPLSGLVCLDLIGGRVIEVNPRLTACAPIAHLRHVEAHIASHRGGGFRITQIDVHTSVPVPTQCLHDGRLRALIDRLQTDYGVLALPQGLNPFGPCRFVFVNDTTSGTAQQVFLRQIERLGHS